MFNLMDRVFEDFFHRPGVAEGDETESSRPGKPKYTYMYFLIFEAVAVWRKNRGRKYLKALSCYVVVMQ